MRCATAISAKCLARGLPAKEEVVEKMLAKTYMRKIFAVGLLATCLLTPSAWAQTLPDSHLTPGGVLPDVTAAEVCKPGWASEHREVPEPMREEVYREYGTSMGELDHLIPLELGGSNDIENLWVQPWKEAREKDALENWLHERVCNGETTLGGAQKCIATNWLECFNTALHVEQAETQPNNPASSSTEPEQQPQPKAQEAESEPGPQEETPQPQTEGQILANPRSGIYFWPGCPNYNQLKNPIPFSSAEAAEAAGYRAARNCEGWNN
jgi:Metal binding domain of Ada